LVILLLMVRSIRRSNSAVEVESLLESMRFREELDIQQRQKRRLQKAKNKVSAWLLRTGGKASWNDSRQTPFIATKPTKKAEDIRTNSLQSGTSYLPEIVISKSDEGVSHSHLASRQNSCTPSLSLIYDFGAQIACAGPEWSRKNSAASSCSDTGDLSVSDLTFNSSNDLAIHGSNSHDDDAFASSTILYESLVTLGSESDDLESIPYGRSSSSGLRSASLDAGSVGSINISTTPLALQLPPTQLSAHHSPTPTATTPIAPNQRQQFFPGTHSGRIGDARPNSSLSLQLKPNYYSLTRHNHPQYYQGPPK